MLESDLYQNPLVQLQLRDDGIKIDTKVVKFEKDRVFLELDKDFQSYLGFFQEGKQVNMMICGSTRVVQLESLVIETYGFNTIVMELHDEFSVVQRRKFVRVNAEYELELSCDNFILHTITTDIGGGGLRFVGNEQLKVGQNYNFNLKIPDLEDTIEGKGVIINKVYKDSDAQMMFCFTEIMPKIRNKITRLCYEKEFNS